MQYGLFLKGIGVSLEDSLRYWKDGFSQKTDADKFEKVYAYNIRHNYGAVGKRTSYTPYSCIKIITSNVGPDDAHGCPFKHSDASHLKQQLLAWNLPTADINKVAEYVTQGRFDLACTKYFEVTHGVQSDGVIGHPNQYFKESQKVFNGKHDVKGAAKGVPVREKLDTSDLGDVWGDDKDLESIDVDIQQEVAM
jgi:DNA primase large subunit